MKRQKEKSHCRKFHHDLRGRAGLSLLELLATLLIMGILAGAMITRITGSTGHVKGSSCAVNKNVIEVQAALWKRATGSWPDASLKDMGSDPDYFPEGLPVCPSDGTSYQIDSTTGRVLGHSH